MDLGEACSVLGIADGSSEKDVQSAFHGLMRLHHPDVVSARTENAADIVDASRLTEAYAIIVESIRTSPAKTVPAFSPTIDQPPSFATPSITSEHDGDTIWIEAPPDETYQHLLEAAATLGGIGHVDRTLGLLEVIVRFEGGPSCSVLMTLQGRAHGTDVFCEMESIEAEPTPAIIPVLDALVEQLRTPN